MVHISVKFCQDYIFEKKRTACSIFFLNQIIKVTIDKHELDQDMTIKIIEKLLVQFKKKIKL